MSLADETGTITLGGEKFPVKAFTLDQLQEAMGLFREFDGIVGTFDQDTGKGGLLDPEAYGVAAQLFALALAREPSEIRVSFDEVLPAVQILKEVSGLLPLLERLSRAIETAKSSPGTASTPTS
jgi:hypothetical protein